MGYTGRMKLIPSLRAPEISSSWKSHLRYVLHLAGRIVVLAFLIWCAQWLYSAIDGQRYLARPVVITQSQYDVVAFGDSLVEGLGAEHLDGFVDRLQKSTGVTILNEGHRGDETGDLVRRVDADVLAYHPKIVIVVIGGNDAVRFVPESEILANLDALFAKLRAENITVIFGEVTDDVLYGERNRAMRDLATKHHVVYVQHLMQGIFWTLSNKFDPLHPNDEGYQKISDRLLPYLQEALRGEGN